jgi:glycosyltransferase involved in cell wall biosynthesis
VRRLVFVTQLVDCEHPVLATAVAKIAALAERVDHVTVLALDARPGMLPDNCSVKTFGASTQKLRGLRFFAALAPELAFRRPAAVLAHMSPIYASLAAPVARPLGVRVLLWYTQWRSNKILERAVERSDAVLTVDDESFPFDSEKVQAIGHGIDLARFACVAPPGRERLRLLALGRYSPVKGYPGLIDAALAAGAQLEIHGSLETPVDREHKAELGEHEGVTIGGPVPPSEVPALLASADALVSGTRGGADKVVLEAAASCVPAFSPAPAFAHLLPAELRYDHDLAEKLRAFAAIPTAQRAELGRQLRATVEREHSVDAWADRVIEAAGL